MAIAEGGFGAAKRPSAGVTTGEDRPDLLLAPTNISLLNKSVYDIRVSSDNYIFLTKCDYYNIKVWINNINLW